MKLSVLFVFEKRISSHVRKSKFHETLCPVFFWLIGTSSTFPIVFVWIISNQPTVLFSPKRPTTTDKLGVLFSQHQPNEHEHFLSAPAERT
jgi:hypothetical protein